ncbi:MAG: c-type cytochrome biogenesis protein CcmI, partial [Caulobacteraceae bacterium]|nr:c-type cytochrome biogenesis protein CcmI [Caulobacter sp.]
MWLFWICAGALAAAAALLVASRGASAARRAQDRLEDPALAVHRRALSELDDLAARGLVAPAELAAAQAEAGRRLLSAADVARRPERPAGRGSRLIVTLGAALAALLALGVYLAVGAPGYPDQPYARRLAGWSSPDRLEQLDAPRLAAVLEAVTRKRPDDPQAFDFLGRARMAAGDFGSAAQAFEHAARLAPANAAYPAEAGEALLAGQEGKVPPEAQAAFREALRRDPRNAAARYH